MPSKVVLQVNRELETALRSLGGASSPEMRENARILKKSIKGVIGTKSKKVSAPGEPPIGKSGGLQKSVVSGVVGAGQRVAVMKFTAPLLQFGVDTRGDGTAPRSRRNLFTGAAREVERSSLLAFSLKVARRQSGKSTKARHMKLDARPFMERGLARAQDQMIGATVSTIQRRTPA